jgi:cytochrome c oxidase cbb3-type subunit 3
VVELAEANAPAIAKRFAAANWAEIEADPELRAYGAAAGRGLFGQNCAACHGADGRGATGFPNLADRDWLWGGDPEAIEHTIRVGIRWPGSDETRTSMMPAFGAQKQLERSQIRDMVDWLRAASGQEHDAAAAQRATPLFAENCAACHGENGKGNPEVGAPNLTDGIWLYGGDRAKLYESLWHGRGGVMPAFGGRLSDDMIRKVVLHVRSLGE